MGGKTDDIMPEGTHAAVSHQQLLHCALYLKHDTDEKCHKLLFLKTLFSLTTKCHKGFRATVYFYQIQNNLEFPQID